LDETKGFIVVEDASTLATPTIIGTNSSKESIKFEAELQEAEAPNRNGRIYDFKAIDDALNYYTVKEKIKHKAFFGEAGHPLSSDIKRQLYIDQNNISHIVESVRWSGNHLMGVVETANTSVGRDMAGLIRQGSQASFSMRGVGNVKVKDGSYTRIKSPLFIVAYDYVVIPSHPNSYMTRIINESAQVGNKIQGSMMEDVDMEYLLDFVKNNSENVHAMTESLELNIDEADEIKLENQNAILSLKYENESLKIYLEDNIRSHADKFFSSFFYRH